MVYQKIVNKIVSIAALRKGVDIYTLTKRCHRKPSN